VIDYSALIIVGWLAVIYATHRRRFFRRLRREAEQKGTT
jgi:hypothetical protein